MSYPTSERWPLNEAAIALDGSNRRYRKGIPIAYMQANIRNAIQGQTDYLCLLIDEVDNIRPNPDSFLTFFVKTLPGRWPAV
jgi:cell division control protein 6